MSDPTKRNRTALKHGGYSATAVLPGESAAEFEKLHRDLVSELDPTGPLEEDTVENIARLLWRKKNLRTLSIAEDAQSRWSAISRVDVDYHWESLPLSETRRPKSEEEIQSAESEVKESLGENFRLVGIGEGATFDGMEKELLVKERLDSLIDRCLKRLLFLRGLKSIAPSSAKHIIGPAKAS